MEEDSVKEWHKKMEEKAIKSREKKIIKYQVGFSILKLLYENNLTIEESIEILNQVKANILSTSTVKEPIEFAIYPFQINI